MNGTHGLNTAYLSITYEQFNSMEPSNYTPSTDSLFKLIIDADPFEVFYVTKDRKGEFRNRRKSNHIDTVKINRLIREDNLDKYFDRLK